MLGRVKLEKERLEGEIKNFEGVVNLLEKDIKELKDKQNVATDTIKKRDEVRQACTHFIARQPHFVSLGDHQTQQCTPSTELRLR